jgi:hypothetical protein
LFEPRQGGYDLFHDPVCEIFLVGIAAHVGEWQYRYRRSPKGNRAIGSDVGTRRRTRPHKPVTDAGHSDDERLTLLAQRLAQRRDLHREIGIFNDGTRPRPLHQSLPVHRLAVRLY